MKKPSPDQRQRMCTQKRRYRSEGDALDAALLVTGKWGASAYRCPICGQWHLASKRPRNVP
jgi:hypothetical protein